MISKRIYIFFPVVILIAEWIVVFYLHYNNPYHFLVMSKGTLSIILLGLLSLLLGYFTVHSFYFSAPSFLRNRTARISINEKAFGSFIVALSLIAFIGLLISLKEIAKVTNGLQLYFTNPFLAREQIITLQEGTAHHVSQISYKIGSYLCSLMYPLATLGGIAIAMRSKWKLTGLIPLLLVVVYSLVNLNRFGLITSLGLWFFTLLYFSMYLPRNEQKALLKKVLLYTLIAAVLVALFFYLIMSIRAFYATDLNHFIKRSFYAYFSGSPAAFEKLLYEPGPMTYGASSFRSVVKWFSRFGLMESGAYMGAHNAFRNIGLGMPMTLNTFTFVKTMYEDFGILGVAFISAGWGMLARYAIEKSFLRFSILNLFIVSVFVLSFFMTFYEFFFQGITMFVYWSLILLFIERYFENRGILLHGTER